VWDTIPVYKGATINCMSNKDRRFDRYINAIENGKILRVTFTTESESFSYKERLKTYWYVKKHGDIIRFGAHDDHNREKVDKDLGLDYIMAISNKEILTEEEAPELVKKIKKEL